MYKSNNKNVEIGLTLARYALLLGVYGGVVVVAMAIFAMKAAEGETPSMPVATMCIVNLSVQYFAVFLLLIIIQTVRQFSGLPLTKSMQIIQSTVFSCKFIPALSVLFLASRMRSQEVVAGGAPQGWAQDAMVLASGAVALQAITAIISGLLTPGAHDN